MTDDSVIDKSRLITKRQSSNDYRITDNWCLILHSVLKTQIFKVAVSILRQPSSVHQSEVGYSLSRKRNPLTRVLAPLVTSYLLFQASSLSFRIVITS